MIDQKTLPPLEAPPPSPPPQYDEPSTATNSQPQPQPQSYAEQNGGQHYLSQQGPPPLSHTNSYPSAAPSTTPAGYPPSPGQPPNPSQTYTPGANPQNKNITNGQAIHVLPTGPQSQYAQTQAGVGAQFQQELYARCARGDHDFDTKYGPCGIITAIFCFPIGLICLFMDTEKKCVRCGYIAPR